MLSKEQKDIVYSSGNIKVNAFAGAGKTTTVIEYVKARPSTSSFLYLVFNKSVKLEAIEKFKKNGLSNVTVETAHSMAYSKIVMGSKYKVKMNSYKTHEVATILKIKNTGQRHTQFIIANHVLKYVAMFCNSSVKKVMDIDYLNAHNEIKTRLFIAKHLSIIQTETRNFLALMDKGSIEITHDFYLKKYQLSNSVLNYDYILFDEGQDASGCILDVFMKQTAASKLIVGDTHQQIYSWRYAVNSLEKANYKNFYLTCSFRFHQDIADLANSVLRYKNLLQIVPPETNIYIEGKGKNFNLNSFAIISRTNIGLLHRAIAYVLKNPKNTIYFEGNISSYTYADDGASLYDVYYLSVNKNQKIKDPILRNMNSLDELKDYVDSTNDVQLRIMMDIINDYGNDIFTLISELKNRHVTDSQKQSANVIFSTVHKAKGQEYDKVELVSDFITQETIFKNKDKIEGKFPKEDNAPIDIVKLNEEVNLLYVAITRAKHTLLIPENILPLNFKPKTHLIEIIKFDKK